MPLGRAQRFLAEGSLLIAEYRTGTGKVARIVEAPPENVERDVKVTDRDGVAYRLGWVWKPGIRQSRRIAWVERDGA